MESDLDCEIDVEVILKRVGGRRPIMKKVIEQFLQICPQQVEVIGEAVRHRDADTLARASHRLRGSASNFEARVVVELTSRLEAMGRSNDMAEADALFSQLEQAAAFLLGRLKGLTLGGD